MWIDKDVLGELSKKLSSGKRTEGDMEEEKECIKLIHNLDHVAGHVQGSSTLRKYM